VGRPILEFLLAQANRFHGDPYCPTCDHPFTFIDATFWIYEDDEACTIPLPFCLACESGTLTSKDLLMSNTALQAFDSTGWKQAYIAALFETDKRKISCLIAAAEMAVALRARELFGAEGDHSREKAALDTALLGLHSLRDVTEGNNSSVRRIMAANELAA